MDKPIRTAERMDFEIRESADLKEVDLARKVEPRTALSRHVFHENDIASVRSAFWAMLIVFSAIAVVSPAVTDHKEEICPTSPRRSTDRFFLLDLTVASFFRSVSVEVSAVREPSASPLAISFTALVRSTLKSRFEVVNDSRLSVEESLFFRSHETRSSPIFALSLPHTSADLVELRLNVSADFSRVTAFALRSASGSANAELVLKMVRLAFALLAVAIAIFFYVYAPFPFPKLWPSVFALSFIALPLFGDRLSVPVAAVVRLCLAWEGGGARDTRLKVAVSLILWALLREWAGTAAAAAMSIGHCWWFFRFRNAGDGQNLLGLFSWVLSVVSAGMDAVWRPLGAQERFLFGELVFEAAHLATAALLLFLLRPSEGQRAFQIIGGPGDAAPIAGAELD